MTAIDTLSEFVTSTRSSSIPSEVRHRGRLVLADCIGCIIAGNAMPEMRRLAALDAGGGAATATVLGTSLRRAPDRAAFLNGTAGTWHDLDEGNLSTRTHAGIQLAPAALAEAETRSLSGEQLLEAVILAYEASARLWRATDARHAVHPHGTYGPLAAAMALAKLRGDAAAKMSVGANIAMTLGVASSRMALNDGATVRNVYTGHSGRAGFEALALRDIGFSGEHDAASSILGNIYGSAFTAEKAVADLGGTWWIERNYFKRFATGRYSHGALDLTEELAARLGPVLTADAIERIDIATFFWAATMGQQQVRSPFGCRFSIPVAVARMILAGRAPLTDDGAATFADQRVHDLARRIFVTEDKSLTAQYPDRQPTRMIVTFRDGRTETAGCERILGEADHPLSDAALEAKFVELTSPSLGATAPQVWRDLMRIEAVPDLGAFIRGWRTAASST